MKKMWSVGIIIIGIFEILIGSFGILGVVYLLTFKMRTGESSGMGILLLPLLLICSVPFLLGLGILLRRRIKVASMGIWYVHMFLIPFILLVCLPISIFFNYFKIFGVSAIIGIPIICYLAIPKVKEQFR